MLTKQSILLLVIPTLLTLPVGIAKADNIHVQTDDQTVTIDDDNGITIESGPQEMIIPPESSPSLSRRWILNLPKPRKSPWCRERSYTHQDTQTSNSSAGVSHTQSSVSIQTCQ
ncbi:MAG: hypothetical protein GVY04_16130 [Cyanobacteria bacterium]|jgi:hypothetical protein|nr:hypothetical protein [Cyanobacteria bacterium GSL.Bin1]